MYSVVAKNNLEMQDAIIGRHAIPSLVLFHFKRESTYTVVKLHPMMKTSRGWKVGVEYKCREDGAEYLRAVDEFIGFGIVNTSVS